MRLLIADRIRRTNRWMMLCLVVTLTAMWWLGVESQQPGRAHAASMAVAFTFGQMCLLFVPRAIYQLPVSRREIWRSGWIVATLGGTAFTLGAKAVAFVMPSVRASIGLSDVALSTVYDFSAAGVACGIVIVATRPRPAGGPLHHPWPILKRLAEMTLPLGLMAGFYGPMWLTCSRPRAGPTWAAAASSCCSRRWRSPSPPISTLPLLRRRKPAPNGRRPRPATRRSRPVRGDRAATPAAPRVRVDGDDWRRTGARRRDGRDRDDERGEPTTGSRRVLRRRAPAPRRQLVATGPRPRPVQSAGLVCTVCVHAGGQVPRDASPLTRRPCSARRG